MRAAIYARRSTDEHQASSLEVQIGEATRFIARNEWTLDPAHVYREDAVSRAEFKKRPALLAMLNAAEARAFDVVVVRDETRLGGDGPRTTLLIQDILDAGLQLHFYFTGERVSIDDATAKFMVSVRNFAAELEREKISQRTHEHLLTKARRGLNVGGRVYGYDNVEVRSGDRRLHVEYKLNPEQAEVVRWIFRRYADGWGLKRLVKDLNARKVPPPRAGKRGTGSWSPSAVHAMLRRERYRGIIVWNKREKTYRKGTKIRVARPASDWETVTVEHLRVIDEPLWSRVQARLAGNARVGGRPAPGRPPRYLLSGLARCGICGGPIAVNNGKSAQTPIKVYLCQYHRTRGDEVCASATRRPVEDVDRTVLEHIARKIVTEDVALDALKLIRRRLLDRARLPQTQLRAMEKEATRLRAEVERLVSAIATGAGATTPEALVQAVADRQAKLADLEARLRAAKAAPDAIHREIRRLEDQARAALRDFGAALEQRSTDAKAMLQRILAEPLRFTPEAGGGFRIEGAVAVDRALASGAPNWASPAGFEPALQP